MADAKPQRPYVVCMKSGPRVIILSHTDTVEDALKAAGAAQDLSVLIGHFPKRLWIEARNLPATRK